MTNLPADFNPATDPNWRELEEGEVVNIGDVFVRQFGECLVLDRCGYVFESESHWPTYRRITPEPATPKTDKVSPGIDQIPFEAMEAEGAIYAEGEPKYDRDNWKKGVGNIEYQRERTRHALRHLQLWANGDRSEDHLAKVRWFTGTQIWIEKQEAK